MNTSIDTLRAALEAAKNGLIWYREQHPEDDSGADDEMMAEIEAALASSPQQVVDPVGAASEITDEQIIALWDSWPRQGITSRALAVEFARKVLATQATTKAEPPILTLNGYQLRAALNFNSPDGTAEQLEADVCIQHGPARTDPDDGTVEPAGLYCWSDEYPEEGAIRLGEEPNSNPGSWAARDAQSPSGSPPAASTAWNALRDDVDKLTNDLDVRDRIMRNVRTCMQRQYQAGKDAS